MEAATRFGNWSVPFIVLLVQRTVVITDARVLQPEFIPTEVAHRDAEVDHLSSVLAPITEGDRAEPAFLYGPSGVGKTCIAQFTVERLREAVLELNYQYVNCWEDYNRFKTLYRLLEGINRTVDVHRQATPQDVLLDRLREYDGPPYVVILDEVDQLTDKGLLYELYRIPTVTMVLIANDESALFGTLDGRLTSRLQSATRIEFTPYSDDELTAILADRVRWGFTEGVIDRPRLEAVANHAAGDARVAISVLRKAARTAEGTGLEEIPLEVIRESVPEAKAALRQQTIDRLPRHQQTLYEIISEAGEIDPGTLYDRYTAEVTTPKSRRMVRNYLSKLEQYNLIVAEGRTRGRLYRLAESAAD